ncbi:MAG: hypothetical protein ACKO0V_08535 [bacterium]
MARNQAASDHLEGIQGALPQELALAIPDEPPEDCVDSWEETPGETDRLH